MNALAKSSGQATENTMGRVNAQKGQIGIEA